MKNFRANKARAGFLAADAMIGLAIVAILASAMAVAVSRHNRASQRLAESRAAVRLAEQTIFALQTGQTPPATPPGVTIRVQPVQVPGEAPAGCAWASVTVTRDGRTTKLSGLVRADAVKGVAP